MVQRIVTVNTRSAALQTSELRQGENRQQDNISRQISPLELELCRMRGECGGWMEVTGRSIVSWTLRAVSRCDA